MHEGIMNKKKTKINIENSVSTVEITATHLTHKISPLNQLLASVELNPFQWLATARSQLS